MTRTAILTPSIVANDAVSNDVVGMYHTLARQGHEVGLFAENWSVSGVEIRHINEIKSFLCSNSALLIYHYSIGWDVGLAALREIPCRKVVRYHNVTPPQFFIGTSMQHVNACQIGKEQIQSITQSGCDLYLATSDYNMQELIQEGVDKSTVQVVPPFHHIDRLFSTEAELAIIDTYHRDGRVNVLTVGRLVPNKGHAALIDAFATYYYGYNSQSRLLIIGKKDERLSTYTESLYEQVARLGLQSAVIFSGEVSNEALKAYYLISNVFMTTSLHEGFCVPLVEAMAMKLPIIAYGSSAIPCTVGKAGLVWSDLAPDLMAESINYVVQNEESSVTLGLLGWQRYTQHFTNEKIEAALLKVLNELL